MQTTMIAQPGLRISVKTGSEGPRHDPYHYEEFTVERNGAKFMEHCGLAHYVEMFEPGWAKPLHIDNPKGVGKACQAVTGFTLNEWRRFIHKRDNAKARQHRGHDVRSECGYPGEYFTICHTCGGEMLDSHFNIGDVE
jgi:hypothetical protein